VVELTFRDVVTIDRGQLAMGSQKVGGRTVKLEAVTLQGSATGTRSVPLANVLAQSVRSVTRARISVHVISPNQPTLLLQLRLVETQTAGPTA
jgi:hypothetical protein